MARPDTAIAAHQALLTACSSVREYSGCAPYTQAIEMLDALESCYVLELRETGPDGLVRLQSALRQVGLIRNVLTGDAESLPKI